MRIATYNVNGINGRLDVLLRWLGEARPDVVCASGAQSRATSASRPRRLKTAGYDAIWHGQKSWNGVAILSRCGAPIETRRGLPGDPDPRQSRYIEAAVKGVIVAGLVPAQRQSPPRSQVRLTSSPGSRSSTPTPPICWRARRRWCWQATINVMPTELDVYKPERWVDDAHCSPPKCARRLPDLVAQGWTDALRHLHPDERIYTFWHYWRRSFERDAGLQDRPSAA